MSSRSQSLYKGSDEIYNEDCDVCVSNGKISEAISFSKICCEHLCQACDLAHRGSKATRDHTILVGSNIPSVSTKKQPTLPFMFCDTHRTSVLDSYCSTHDVVMCPACKMTNHVICSTRIVYKHGAKIDVEKELKKVANRLRDLEIRYDDNLNKLEKKMSSEIRQIEETMKKEIDAHVTLADEILNQIGDLKTSLSECEKTREDDVMFVGSKKPSSRASEYDLIIGIYIYPIDIRFQPNDVLSDMIQQIHSLGNIAINRPVHSGPNQTSVLNMSVKEKRAIDAMSNEVWGCTCMPDGHVVLACGEGGLKLFDGNFLFKTKLTVVSGDVSTINANDVIVTQGYHKKLQRVRIFPGIKVMKTLKMDRNCYGVDVCGDEIYVTCNDNPGKGEVRVFNIDGKVLRRMGVENGEYIFTRPGRVIVNREASKIFISEWDTHTVTCLNNQSHVIYRYSGRDLESPLGMYVDREDNLLVCGLNSHNVHMIRKDGRQEKLLLSEKDGIHFPMCISYRPSDGCLVVGLHQTAKTDQKLIIFSTR